MRPGVISIRDSREYQDPALLGRAFSMPVASAYRNSLVFQSNPSACGPTSVANMARTLGESDATARAVTAGTGHCPMGLCLSGLTLDEVAEVIEKHLGRRVETIRGPSLESFRQRVRDCNDPALRCLVNFDRGTLFGKGGGHHSPIGGYLSDEDLVLVIDVNGSFGPWLVKTERLLAAMNAMDSSTGKPRGMLVIH